jgi:signal transduction histidine kinase
VNGMSPKYIFNYYVDAGIGYYFFVVFFIFVASIGSVKLLSFSEINRNKNLYVWFGSIVGFIGGGSSFLLSFNIMIPPYLFILFGLLPIIIAGGIFKYRLFNMRLIAIELFIIFIWVFMAIRLALSETYNDIAVNLATLIAVVILGALIIRGTYQMLKKDAKIFNQDQILKKYNTKLTYLDRQKSEFISFATHQLRAPLTAMKGYASLILDGDMGKIDDKARVGIQRIYESSNTLAEIVDDYLNITRIELGTMQYRFDTISVKALLREVVEELKPNFEKKQTKLLLDIDESADYRMSADKSKLKQVFENLIDNAFKYTPKGQVKVSLFRDLKKSKIIVKITDTGIGVSEDNLPKLFEKFSRARNADQTNKKGTGLGLFVAKEIVKSHKGDIYATSPGEGKGTEFTVELDPINKI